MIEYIRAWWYIEVMSWFKWFLHAVEERRPE
jgi:hypothetical protein